MHALSRERKAARIDNLNEGRHTIEPVIHIGSVQE
jgi:hypothetical protein